MCSRCECLLRGVACSPLGALAATCAVGSRTTTCAFVPVNPKLLTTAVRRGPASLACGHGWSLIGTERACALSTLGLRQRGALCWPWCCRPSRGVYAAPPRALTSPRSPPVGLPAGWRCRAAQRSPHPLSPAPPPAAIPAEGFAAPRGWVQRGDHGQHAVVVSDCLGQQLQDNYATPLTDDGPFGSRVQGPAGAISGHNTQGPEVLQRALGQNHVASSGDCHVALPPQQRLARLAHRHQRRAAGRVHRQRWAARIQRVSDRPGSPRRRCTSAVVGAAHHLGALSAHLLPVLPKEAEVEPRAGAAHRIGADAGVLQRRPAHVVQQPVLWVHQARSGLVHPIEA
eukprot:3468730-Rhodomonas_salina.1